MQAQVQMEFAFRVLAIAGYAVTLDRAYGLLTSEAGVGRSEEGGGGKRGRYWRDWSSDVRSSDLTLIRPLAERRRQNRVRCGGVARPADGSKFFSDAGAGANGVRVSGARHRGLRGDAGPRLRPAHLRGGAGEIGRGWGGEKGEILA